MANWNMGRMVSTAQGAPVDPNQQRAVNNLSGVMQATGTPISSGQFGSGIGYQQPHASSNAIASFANLAPGTTSPGAPAAIPQTPTAPVAPAAPAPSAPGSAAYNQSRSNSYITSRAGRDNWWNAVQANAMTPEQTAALGTRPTYDQYVTGMNAAQQHAQAQGLSPEDTNQFLGQLNYQGLNTYGATPEAQLARFREGQQRGLADAQAKQGLPWVAGGG